MSSFADYGSPVCFVGEVVGGVAAVVQKGFHGGCNIKTENTMRTATGLDATKTMERDEMSRLWPTLARLFGEILIARLDKHSTRPKSSA